MDINAGLCEIEVGVVPGPLGGDVLSTHILASVLPPNPSVLSWQREAWFLFCGLC